MNAQISFLEGQFSLIHIPLPLYSALLQPILRVLLPHGGPTNSSGPEGLLEGLSTDNKHGFLNISVTPIECSIVCHTSWARSVFEPVIQALPKSESSQVQISKDTYIIFSVSSAGMEAGQRVMDLTAPLAMAGIPIFFITTYYTDFILVPAKDRNTVGNALLARGFEFSENDSAYVAPTNISHSRLPSASSDPPSTPPPTNIAELQVRTFSHLKKRNVRPFIVEDLTLVQCSGREIRTSDIYGSHHSLSSNQTPKSWLENIDPALYCGLVSALVQQPKFLSVTLAQDDAPSLLLDKSLLWLFGNSIAGDTECDLVPIFLDLVDLPLESTGIVCGVAGKLVDEMKSTHWGNGNGHGNGMNGNGDTNGLDESANELSYLSTARAGAVVLSSEGSVRALEALLPLLEKTEA
ncbi:ACT domain-containing protein [Tricladium varicosporioides]|nr:ACT domain-containing protein [Hymenoscyphus varicosporioides]